jgi:hypothetical protein
VPSCTGLPHSGQWRRRVHFYIHGRPVYIHGRPAPARKIRSANSAFLCRSRSSGRAFLASIFRVCDVLAEVFAYLLPRGTRLIDDLTAVVGPLSGHPPERVRQARYPEA